MGADFLRIHNLHVRTGDKPLKGLDLTVGRGEVHDHGSEWGRKSPWPTLMGHPQYEISEGDRVLRQILNDLKPHERAKAGLFLSFSIQKRFPALRWRPS